MRITISELKRIIREELQAERKRFRAGWYGLFDKRTWKKEEPETDEEKKARYELEQRRERTRRENPRDRTGALINPPKRRTRRERDDDARRMGGFGDFPDE